MVPSFTSLFKEADSWLRLHNTLKNSEWVRPQDGGSTPTEIDCFSAEATNCRSGPTRSNLPPQVKTREPAHRRCTEELHFVDEYGQPITMQVDGRKGRGHRRRRPHCTNVPAGGHWEALRAMGLMEGEKGRGDGYRAAWVPGGRSNKKTGSPETTTRCFVFYFMIKA